MKKLFALCSALSLLIVTSCEDKYDCGCSDLPVNEKSYIQSFIGLGEIRVCVNNGIIVDKTKNTIINNGSLEEPEIYDVKNGVSIHINIVSGGEEKDFIDWRGSNADYYYELTEKIGDTSYNAKYGDTRYANADTLRYINVTCDKAIDSNHPAGSSLNDILSLYFMDICAYVKNGYMPVTGPDYYSIVDYDGSTRAHTYFGDKLSSVNLVDKPHGGLSLTLMLETTPEHTDEYTFTVSVTNKQGKTVENTTEPVRIKGINP